METTYLNLNKNDSDVKITVLLNGKKTPEGVELKDFKFTIQENDIHYRKYGSEKTVIRGFLHADLFKDLKIMLFSGLGYGLETDGMVFKGGQLNLISIGNEFSPEPYGEMATSFQLEINERLIELKDKQE